ncbi:Abi family protein [Lactobacillus gasseri]|uniref:Abi family protein n=1 Tax=Lactobacillus gasseri TaxID=1596 RepID=UPI003A522E1F
MQKIKELGFYKIKEFANVYLFKSKCSTPKYNKAYFADILTRYYQDKNLRMHIFHASESIEVFLNNQISDLLGKNMELLDTLNLKIGWIGKDLINLK